MKSTGVLRRIDDLGRIVIPKEIRKNLKIKNGEALEIYINDDTVVLKKFSYMSDLCDIAQNCSDAFYDVINKEIIITDRDKIIAVSGSLKRKYLNKEISPFLYESLNKRTTYIDNDTNEINIIKETKEELMYVISPVVVNGDAVGSVIILSKDIIGEVEEKTANFISRFLAKHLE